MKSRKLLILPLFACVFTLASCKKDEPAPAPAAPPPAAPAAAAPASASAAAALSSGGDKAKTASADHVLSPTEAKDHVGETATVKGKVYGVHATPKDDVFISVGGAYPKAPFTVVRFHSNEQITIDELKALDKKEVQFSGKIKEHNGTIEIILNTPDQFKAEGGTAAKAEAPIAAEAPAAPAAPAAPEAPKADDRPN